MLTEDHRKALASLRSIWPEQRIVLIGATALRAHHRLRRFTADIDLAIAIEQEDYPGALAQHPDWAPDPAQVQRWTHLERTPIDLLPAGPALRAQGHVDWGVGRRMSLRGFDALFAERLPFAEEHLAIEVATVPLIVLLKMVAWLDRPERQRDTRDLAELLVTYVDEHDNDGFERILEVVARGEAEHAAASAYLLGKDVALLVGAPEIATEFITSLTVKNQWVLSDMRTHGPAALHREDAFEAIWSAFTRGLGARR